MSSFFPSKCSPFDHEVTKLPFIYHFLPTIPHNLNLLPFTKLYIMESLTQKIALKFTRVNFVPENVTNTYYHRGSLVQIKSPTTPTTLTTPPTRNTRLSSPISGSKIAAGAGTGEGEEPKLKTNRIRDPVSSADMAAHEPILKDDRIAGISSAIRVIPDFPKPGNHFFCFFDSSNDSDNCNSRTVFCSCFVLTK